MNAETLKELLANATPGPWGYSQCSCGHPSCNQQIMDNQGNVGFSEPDARLIALAPQLAEEVINLQAEVESLKMQVEILSPLYSVRQALSDENARLREALREVTQTLSWQCFGECRGFSDNLLEPSDAVAIARAALNETPDTASVLPR